MSKTNAIRKLELLKIEHQLIEYQFNEKEIDAVSVAKKVGEEPERVFKTLVARNEKNHILVFVIPGNYNLDLKKAAKTSSSKKIEMIKEKELLSLTGYIKGGCSPIGMKKLYQTYLDESVELWEYILVSAGVRGTQVKIKPDDLIKTVKAILGDLL